MEDEFSRFGGFGGDVLLAAVGSHLFIEFIVAN
jgi:hypothetical protein